MTTETAPRSLRARATAIAPELALLVAFLALVAVHLLWLHHFRRGLPLDTDENGYLGFALADLWAYDLHGPYSFFAHATHVTFAPLVPLTAAPFLGQFGHRPLVGMSTQLIWLAILAAAVYALFSRLRDRRAGVLAAILAMLLPGVFDFTRTFHFVLASTAFLCLAVCALVRSNGLTHRIWTILFGLAVGLMLLSRTVNIAFLPGLGVAVILLLLSSGRRDVAQRAINLGLGTVAGLAVTLWWYVPNVGGVVDYLAGQGYDSEFTKGFPSSPLDLDFWTARAGQIARGLYFVPAVILTIAIVWRIVQRVNRRRENRIAWLSSLSSPFGLIAVVFVTSYFVFTTSPDPGTAFVYPLLPLALVMGMHALLSLPARAKAILVVGLVGSITLVAIGKTSVTGLGALTSRRCVDLPSLGCVPLADGRGNIHEGMQNWGLDLRHPDAARRGEPGGWVELSTQVAIELRKVLVTRPAVIAFASRDPLFNTNSVTFAYRQLFGPDIPMTQLHADNGDTELNYAMQLALPEFGQPTLLFTAERGPAEFPPFVSQVRATRAATCLGFERAGLFFLPDGRSSSLYIRNADEPPPATRRAVKRRVAKCHRDRQ